MKHYPPRPGQTQGTGGQKNTTPVPGPGANEGVSIYQGILLKSRERQVYFAKQWGVDRRTRMHPILEPFLVKNTAIPRTAAVAAVARCSAIPRLETIAEWPRQYTRYRVRTYKTNTNTRASQHHSSSSSSNQQPFGKMKCEHQRYRKNTLPGAWS